jgi:hypothetical protein
MFVPPPAIAVEHGVTSATSYILGKLAAITVRSLKKNFLLDSGIL